MQVYWENYDGKKRLPGRKQWISWHFEYGGSKRIIPYLYRFPQGIAFDLITLLNAEELRLFSSKYENSLEHLSSVQQRAIREEHPYQAGALWRIYYKWQTNPRQLVSHRKYVCSLAEESPKPFSPDKSIRPIFTECLLFFFNPLLHFYQAGRGFTKPATVLLAVS